MPLINNCNVCKKELTDIEKEESDKVKLPRMCEQHLKELTPKIEKCLKLFQNMRSF